MMGLGEVLALVLEWFTTGQSENRMRGHGEESVPTPARELVQLATIRSGVSTW